MRLSSNVCVEAHMRELLEQGFEVERVRRDSGVGESGASRRSVTKAAISLRFRGDYFFDVSAKETSASSGGGSASNLGDDATGFGCITCHIPTLALLVTAGFGA